MTTDNPLPSLAPLDLLRPYPRTSSCRPRRATSSATACPSTRRCDPGRPSSCATRSSPSHPTGPSSTLRCTTRSPRRDPRNPSHPLPSTNSRSCVSRISSCIPSVQPCIASTISCSILRDLESDGERTDPESKLTSPLASTHDWSSSPQRWRRCSYRGCTRQAPCSTPSRTTASSGQTQ
jgi:hypothetical protein